MGVPRVVVERRRLNSSKTPFSTYVAEFQFALVSNASIYRLFRAPVRISSAGFRLRFLHVPPNFPTTKWSTSFGLPWWRDRKRVVGKVSRSTFTCALGGFCDRRATAPVSRLAVSSAGNMNICATYKAHVSSNH